ncbi:MAG: leucine-rich repeat domain-containing protein [Candidatus Caenarcaniphilales bacterium]|nr:leucine-rich repeat domain-containing protein [Candidatus Caenarcaniphilales bacterium]
MEAREPEKKLNIKPISLRVPEITILSDHAVDEHESEGLEDFLDYDKRLLSLFDIIRHANTQCPMSLGIYGDWGSGKTSTMRWLEKRLEDWSRPENDFLRVFASSGHNVNQEILHPKIHTIWFDPWKYHDRESVWKGIIAEIILKCTDRNLDEVSKDLNEEQKQKTIKEHIEPIAKRFGSFLGVSFVHTLANMKFKVGADVTGVELDGKFVKEIINNLKISDKPEKAYLNEFEVALKESIDKYLKDKAGRLVIFIDDLDRCLPGVALEVLEALKLYLNMQNLIFVVGLDREVIDGVIKKHYKDNGLGEAKAKDYLAKMFQVEFYTNPSETLIAGFHEEQIRNLDKRTAGKWTELIGFSPQEVSNESDSDDVASERQEKNSEEKNEYEIRYNAINISIKALARNNPREIKRLINSTFTRGYEASIGAEDSETRKLLFAQGVQVYLIQNRLAFFNKANLICETRVQEAFGGFSQALRKLDTQELVSNLNRLEDGRKNFVEGESIEQERQNKPGIEEIYEKSFANIKDLIPLNLINDEWLINLLKTIEFSSKVAASVPPSDDENQSFEDSDIAAMSEQILNAIAISLNKPVGDIKGKDLGKVESLDLSSLQLENIAGLEKLSNLIHLDLYDNNISDINVLEKLPNLTNLDLGHNNISDIGVLEKLTKLTTLDLGHNDISDISVLEKLKASKPNLRINF